MVNPNDRRMLEPGDRLGLGHKPGHNFGTGMKAGQDHLESAGSVQSNVAHLVNDAHSAPAQLVLDFIAGDCRQAVSPALFGRGRRARRKTDWMVGEAGLTGDRGSERAIEFAIRGIG